MEAAQRLRAAIAGARVAFGDTPTSVTVSVGLALPQANDADAATLMRRADELLYRAKAEGRNRVCVAPATAGFAVTAAA